MNGYYLIVKIKNEYQMSDFFHVAFIYIRMIENRKKLELIK